MTQYMIAGAGLGAALIAQCLIEQGVTATDITLCAPKSGMKSSDVPGALMHPLPGTTLRPKPGTMQAYTASRTRIETWRDAHPDVVHRSAMLRPDRGGKRGKRFVNTYLKGREQYVDLTHELLEETTQACPDLAQDTVRAVRYGPTYCVSLAALIPRLMNDLLAQGVTRLEHAVHHIERVREVWHVHAAHAQLGTADVLIWSVGCDLARWFPDVELTVNGGELMVVEATTELTHMISGGGHIACMPEVQPDRWVMGSTYLRHNDETSPHDPHVWERPEGSAESQIREMIARFYPPALHAPTSTLWRGRRLVYTPDKHPIAGALPHAKGLYILGALGSKGLLWGPLLAKQLAALVLGASVPIIKPCDIDRIPNTDWTSPFISHPSIPQ